jgi:general secretion pathway protein D
MQIYQEAVEPSDSDRAGTSNAGPSTTKRSIEVDRGRRRRPDPRARRADRGPYSTKHSRRCRCSATSRCSAALFRSEDRTPRRTNLMVFLRPVVLRDARQRTGCRSTATT